MDTRRIRQVIAEVAAGEDFAAGFALPTVAAIEERTAALVATFPGIVTRRVFGCSRTRAPLTELVVGAGSSGGTGTVLLIGVPRGDAPLGALTALALARRLAEDEGLRREAGAAWHLVPCADPDGARANEGWFGAPASLERYVRHVQLSPPEDRVEWNARPGGMGGRPEGAALLRLIDAIRPELTTLLYDAPVGGVAHFLAADPGQGGLAGMLARLPPLLGLPLDLGGALGPLDAAFAPAIYPLPREIADDGPWVRLQAGRDAAIGPASGPGLAAHAARYGRAAAVVVPRLVDYGRREADRTPAGLTRREAVLAGAQLRREWLAFGRTALELAGPALTLAGLDKSPLRGALAAALREADRILSGTPLDAGALLVAAPRKIAVSPEVDRPATIAEQFANDDCVRFARLPLIGMLVRLLEGASAALPAVPTTEELAATRTAATELRDRWLDDLALGGAYRPVPPDKLIGTQLGAILTLVGARSQV